MTGGTFTHVPPLATRLCEDVTVCKIYRIIYVQYYCM